MTLTLESDVLDGLGLTESDFLRNLAIWLFVNEKVKLGRAAEIAGVSQTEFMRTLGKHRIPIHYDESDFESDLAVVAEREAQRQ